MGLLDEIRNGAITCGSDLDGVLRRCLVLAAKLGHEPFQAWVESELNGYESDADLPPYRIVPSSISVQIWVGGRIINQSLPPWFFSEELREHATTIGMIQSASTLVSLSDEDEEMGVHPGGAIYHYTDQQLRKNRGYLQSARQVVSKSALRGVTAAICNRLMMFVLEIERLDPSIGSAPVGSKPVDEQAVDRAFHLIVEGPGAIVNVSTGTGPIQNVVRQVVPGDLGSLASYLRALGVGDDHLATLEEAVEGANPRDVDDRSSPLSQWIERASEAGKGAAKTLARESLVIAFRVFLGQAIDITGFPPIT